MWFLSRVKNLEVEVERLKGLVESCTRVEVPRTIKGGSTFTVNEYAQLQQVCYSTAWQRVANLKKKGAVVVARKRKDRTTGRTVETYKYVAN